MNYAFAFLIGLLESCSAARCCPFRLISLDCRGHGRTRPLGDRQFLKFNSLTDDITNLLDYLNLSKVVIGGISMGAGVALNFAVRHPERTRALILSRASW